MEMSERHNTNRQDKIMRNRATIHDGVSLLRQLMSQSQPNTAYFHGSSGDGYAHMQGPPHGIMHTPMRQNTRTTPVYSHRRTLLQDDTLQDIMIKPYKTIFTQELVFNNLHYQYVP